MNVMGALSFTSFMSISNVLEEANPRPSLAVFGFHRWTTPHNLSTQSPSLRQCLVEGKHVIFLRDVIKLILHLSV